jgi:helix-turn-helix, Psq domain
MNENCDNECLVDIIGPEPNDRHLQISIQQRKPKQYDKRTLNDALLQIKSGNISAFKASRLYSIPRSTLSNRLRDLHTGIHGSSPILSPQIENEIANWIIDCARWGVPKTRLEVLGAAAELSKLNDEDAQQFRKDLPSIKMPPRTSPSPTTILRC